MNHIGHNKEYSEYYFEQLLIGEQYFYNYS